MPVFEQTYRNYEGQFRQRFRWWIVLEQELRVLTGAKVFLLLVLLASLHFLFRLLQVVAVDVIMQDPNHVLTPFLRQMDFIMIRKDTFFDFVRLQAPILFITMLYAGAGMICNDFRNNLMEVYFSKPLTWWDYVIGKVLTLFLVGMGMTAVPGLILLVMHNMLLPSPELFAETWWWSLSILGFSAVLVLSTALGVLASSALLQSHGYAAIAIFMIVVANSTMSLVLSELLRNMRYLIISYPVALNRLGQSFFQFERPMFNLPWHWPVIYVTFVLLGCLLIIARKVRRAEVA